MATPRADVYTAPSGAVLAGGDTVPQPALALTAASPASGYVDEQSNVFTVQGSNLAVPVTVTPSVTPGPATVTPASVEVSPGSPSATFRITPLAAAVHQVALANSIGLANPSPAIYTSADAPEPGAVEIMAIAPSDNTKMVMFSAAFQGTGAYDRFRTMNGVVLSGASASIGFRAWSFGGSTTPRNFLSATYNLLVDGVQVATASPGTSTGTGSFTVDLNALTEGWHIMSISGVGAGETAVPHGFYVRKSASYVPQPWVPVITGTYEFTQQSSSSTGLNYRQWHVVKVPGTVKRREVPLDKRILHDRAGFTEKLNNSSFAAYQLVPLKFGDRHNPSHGPYGVLNSYATQDYFWHEFLARRPAISLHDGPRGVGTVKFPTHLKFSKRPDGRKIYFTDGWRFGVIGEDGSVRTLAGWRHKSVASHWENPGVGGDPDTVWGANTDPDLELVGDWSSIPVARQGFYEPWGMDWAEPTLTVDEGTPPIDAGTEPMERPHVTGPVAFISDTHNNRIIKVQFERDLRAPGVCTEFITGLSDPWVVVYNAGKLYVTERTGHRISVWNAVTGAFIENLVSNPVAMSGIGASRFPYLIAPYTLADVQAADVVGPEGMDLVGDWLYYGSAAMRCIKRVNINTKEIQFWLQLDKQRAKDTLGFSDAQVFFFPFPDANSNFLNFSISDGTFGPEGSAAIATWSVAHYGLPVLMQPDNLFWETTPGTATAGQGLAGVSYVGATAIKNGVLAYGGAEEGLVVVAKKGNQDIPLVTSTAGRQAYVAAGYHLAHGNGGYGYWGTQLPWDVSSNMNTYLRSMLHIRVPTWRRNKPVNEWFSLPASSITGDADGRLAFSGAALQSTQIDSVLWLGPGGGHNDNSDNSVRSIDLMLDAPAAVLRSAATSVGQRTQDSTYYADGKPSARHLYNSIHWSKLHNRLVLHGLYAAYGTGNYNANKVNTFNPANNTWDADATNPAGGSKNGCMDAKGNIWGLNTPGAHFASALTFWNRATRTQSTLVDYGSPAGGPLAFDSRREQLFSLSWGNGEDLYGTEVRAFVYRDLYSVLEDGPSAAPTRTAITLNSIGGALAQFAADKTEYGGLDYDAGLDAFLFYDGRNAGGVDRRGRVYCIKPNAGTTWDISILATVGTPPHVKGAGVSSRFRYVPNLKGFVLYADGAQPLWFLPTEALV